MSDGVRRSTFLAYLLWQIPGWLVLGAVLWIVLTVFDLAGRIVAGGVAVLVARDVALYPAMRLAFRPRGPDTAHRRAWRGASIGRLAVRDVMSASVVIVESEPTLARLADDLWTQKFTSFPVVSGGTVRGILTVEHVRGVDRANGRTRPSAT